MIIRSQRVPDEYVELEYLEATGTQYINTGIITTALASFDITFMLLADTNMALFGGRNSQTSKTLTMFYLATTKSIRHDFASQLTFSGTTAISHKTNIRMTNDGTVYSLTQRDLDTGAFSHINDRAISTTVPTYQQTLFAVNTGGNIGTFAKCRVYSYTMYDDGTIVRDFIPVKRKSDGVLGMFDTVSGAFFGNSGTGTFLGGGEIRTVKSIKRNGVAQDAIKVGESVLWQTLFHRRYERLNYLEATGTQYINTGIQFMQGDTVELVGKFLNPKHDDGLAVMIPWNSPTNSRFMFAVATTGNVPSFAMSYNEKAGGNNKVSPTLLDDAYHKWRYEGLTLTIDDGAASLTNTEVYKQGTGTIRLFHRYSGACATAIQYYRHWRDGELIADFIPVREKATGTFGMFDRVTGTLFTNAGTGTFVGGAL